MPNPFLTQPLGRRITTLVGVYLTFIFVIADATGFAMILPLATADLHGAELYALASAAGGVLGVVLMPFFGYISARNPHLKPVLLGGSLLFVAAVIALRCAAPNMGIFLVGAFFTSVGTAASYVLGLPLIRDMFPVRRASVLLGFISTASAIGMIAGPIAIGAISDSMGWRGVAYLLTPALAVCALLVFFGARTTKAAAAPFASRYGRFDALGAILLTALVVFLLLPLSLGTSVIPYGSPLNSLLFVLAALAVVGFVLVVRRKKQAAFLPSTVFTERNSLALTIQIFLASGSSLVVLAFVPVYLLNVMKVPAVEVGLASALFALPAFLLGPIIGRWIGRAGTGAPVVFASTAFKVVIMLGLGIWMLTSPSTLNIWIIFIAMFLAGFYNAGQQGVTQTAPQIMIPAKLRAQGTAAVSVQLILGPILGAAAFGGLVVGLGPATGVAIAIISAAVAAALGIIPAFFMRPLKGEESVEVAEAVEEKAEARAEASQHAHPSTVATN